MNTVDIATALEQWAASVIPGLNAEASQPEQLAFALPLVICEITEKRRRRTESGYQQTGMRAWSASLMLLVSPEDTWNASQILYGMIDDLELALARDPTLGGRVPIADSDYTASFQPPEVEHQDGTVARQATMKLSIGEQVKG